MGSSSILRESLNGMGYTWLVSRNLPGKFQFYSLEYSCVTVRVYLRIVQQMISVFHSESVSVSGLKVTLHWSICLLFYAPWQYFVGDPSNYNSNCEHSHSET